MPQHSERRIVPYPAQQMFGLIADIERYPEFLPWCTTARILSDEGEFVTVNLGLSRGMARGSYRRPSFDGRLGVLEQKEIDKIVDGKVEKFYGECVLLEQPFVKNPDQTVQQLRAEEARAHAAGEAARELAANTPKQLRAAQETELRVRKRYEAELGTVIEVADAQRILAQAEVADALARLGLWRARLLEARAKGDLAPFLSLLRNAQ